MKKDRQSRSRVPVTAMGRIVEYHSPAKHPEQEDASTSQSFEDMVEEMARKQSGTLGGARQEARSLQKESPGPARRLQEGIDYLYEKMGGGKRK